MLLLTTQEMSTALIGGMGAVIAAIGAFIVAVLRNENLKLTIVNRLINGVKGKNVINLSDLSQHDIVIKANKILATGEHDSLSLIEQQERRFLFIS